MFTVQKVHCRHTPHPDYVLYGSQELSPDYVLYGSQELSPDYVVYRSQELSPDYVLYGSQELTVVRMTAAVCRMESGEFLQLFIPF